MQPRIQKLLYSFFSRYNQEIFSKGETIIRPQKNRIFFLTAGTVRMYSQISKSELTLNIFKPFSVFPMALILSNKQNIYIYDTLEESKGYFAPKKDFKYFIKTNPDILFDLLKRIYVGLDGYYMLVEALLLGDAYLKILTHLVIYSRRFGKKDKDRVTFDLHLTHRQLASQTGLARESVTKVIKKLQNKRLVGYQGKKLFVYNIVKLEEERFSNSQDSLLVNLPLDKHK